MGTVPATFEATGTDVAVGITRSVTHHRIGLHLVFEGRLEAERLGRAVRLTLDAEPILGCSYQTDAFKAYWKRLPDLDDRSAFRVVETSSPADDALGYLAEEICDAGPQVGVVLLRSPKNDQLGIKVSHVLADGQAAKQYAYLLAETYTRLGSDPEYVVRPNPIPRPTGKEVWAGLTADQRRSAKKAKSYARPTLAVPFTGCTGEGLTYRKLTLDPDRFGGLKASGRARGATVNDVMLTAFFRALVRAFDPPADLPLSIMCTADLRRYLPNANELPTANISMSGPIPIDRVDGERFEETLSRVVVQTDAWAATCFGAANSYSAERMASLGYRATKALLGFTLAMAAKSDKTYPYLTNTGVIGEGRLTFDQQSPASGAMYGPAAAAGPSIVAVVSTYRDTLTVTMGFCETDCEATTVEHVLELIGQELDGFSGARRA